MDIHDVDLDASSRVGLISTRRLPTGRVRLVRTMLHIRGYDSLNVEVLLVVTLVSPALFLVLHIHIITATTIGLLLDVLGRMGRDSAGTVAASSATGLRRSLVLALKHLLLRVETSSVLIHI